MKQRYNGSKHLLLLLTLALTLGLLLGLVLVRVAGLVHLVEQSEGGVLQIVGELLDLFGGELALALLGGGDLLADVVDLLLDLLSFGLVETVLELLEGLLGIVHDAVSAVGGLNGGLALLVLVAVALSIVNHGLDLGVRETGARGNGDRLILVGGLVLSVNVDDRVSIDVEGDLNLGNTAVSRGNTDKLEVAQQLVVTDELTLTLVDLDLDSALEVGGSGEDLGLLGGNGSVAVDQACEDTTKGLDTERKRSDIKEQNVSDLTRQNGTLDGGTDGDGLVGVNRLGWVTAEDALHGLGDLGHTGHTTNEDNLLDVLGLKVGVLERLANGLNSPGNERVNELLELGTSHLLVDVLGTGCVGSDERKVDIGLGRGRKLDLGLLSSLTDTLDSHAVVAQVNALLLLEGLDEVADEGDVKVFATEVGITVGRLDLEDTVLNLENGDIESTTSKIVDGNDAVSRLVKTVGKGSSGGLVDDTEDVEASNLTSVLGSLTLGVVEVGRDGDDGILNGLAHVGLSGLLHLAENETTDLRGRVLLALGLEPSIAVGVLDDLVRHLLDIALNLSIGELATDETLCGEESVLRVHDCLTLRGNTNETLAVLGETDDGRCCAGTWVVVRQC